MAEPRANAGEPPERLVVGHVSKPHGTKGEVFVWPLTDRPDEVFALGSALLMGDSEAEVVEPAREIVVERVRPFKRGLLLKPEGLDDRMAVEPLAGCYLLAPIESLAALEPGEVFYHQLLQAEVVKADGEPVGVVSEVFETEPAHLLEVRSERGTVHLVPFSQRIVKEVDMEAGRIVIDPPPGLLEL